MKLKCFSAQLKYNTNDVCLLFVFIRTVLSLHSLF